MGLVDPPEEEEAPPVYVPPPSVVVPREEIHSDDHLVSDISDKEEYNHSDTEFTISYHTACAGSLPPLEAEREETC